MVFPDGFFRNGTDSDLSRRWAAIEFGDGKDLLSDDTTNHNAKQWPGANIAACFDSDFSADEVAEISNGFESGLNEWYIRGLSRSTWAITPTSREACEKLGVTGPKTDYLWVQRSQGHNSLSATLGNIADGSVFNAQPDSFYADAEGKFPDLALLKARTYAHEIGQ